jgi:hypothetical protein
MTVDGALGTGAQWNLPIENATSPPTYDYNVMVASVNGMVDKTHVLTIYVNHNQPNFIVSLSFLH